MSLKLKYFNEYIELKPIGEISIDLQDQYGEMQRATFDAFIYLNFAYKFVSIWNNLKLEISENFLNKRDKRQYKDYVRLCNDQLVNALKNIPIVEEDVIKGIFSEFRLSYKNFNDLLYLKQPIEEGNLYTSLIDEWPSNLLKYDFEQFFLIDEPEDPSEKYFDNFNRQLNVEYQIKYHELKEKEKQEFKHKFSREIQIQNSLYYFTKRKTTEMILDYLNSFVEIAPLSEGKYKVFREYFISKNFKESNFSVLHTLIINNSRPKDIAIIARLLVDKSFVEIKSGHRSKFFDELYKFAGLDTKNRKSGLDFYFSKFEPNEKKEIKSPDRDYLNLKSKPPFV